MPPVAPYGVNRQALFNAKKPELELWITEANRAAGKKVLFKSGKLVVLRERLAQYYGIDLSQSAKEHHLVAAPGPPPITQEIVDRQWACMRALADEWERLGDAFRLQHDKDHVKSELCPPVVSDGVYAPSQPYEEKRTPIAPSDGLAAAMGPMAAIAASCSQIFLPLPIGNTSAVQLVSIPVSPAMMSSLQASMLTSCTKDGVQEMSMVNVMNSAQIGTAIPYPNDARTFRSECPEEIYPIAGPSSLPPWSGSLQPRTYNIESTFRACPPSPKVSGSEAALGLDCFSSGKADESTPQPGMVTATAVHALQNCSKIVESLKRADGLRDVVAQVERGDVRKVREACGPKTGRAANQIWKSIKVTINRRERLYEQLKEEFQGDQERFFRFFTVPSNELPKRKRRKLERATAADQDGPDNLRPLRLVVEAIPHMSSDVAEEMDDLQYRDTLTGVFSSARWATRWGEMNGWEVWRALGKERYGRLT